ncbi:MAG: ribosome maturation factor RimP [Actinomycetota bacterium]|nr:ribosome maturation factor RimP [Actinomycetota bacterium]
MERGQVETTMDATPATTSSAGPATRLWSVIEPYLAAEDIELDDLEVVGRDGASLVRVVVDAADAVDVDTLARLSRGVSRLLDDADPLSGSYTLEVSSPGLERSLRRPRHFEKAVGRQVRLKTTRPIDGVQHLRGILAEAGPEGITVDAEQGPVTVAYDDVASARTVFVWEKTPKPGGRGREERDG